MLTSPTPRGISIKRQSEIRTEHSIQPPLMWFLALVSNTEPTLLVRQLPSLKTGVSASVRLAWVLGEEDPVCKGSCHGALSSALHLALSLLPISLDGGGIPESWAQQLRNGRVCKYSTVLY